MATLIIKNSDDVVVNTPDFSEWLETVGKTKAHKYPPEKCKEQISYEEWCKRREAKNKAVTTAGADTKTAASTPDLTTHKAQKESIMHAVLRHHMRGGKNAGKPFKINLLLAYNGASAATTSQNPIVSIVPGSSTEFASLANIFDEFIMDGCTTHLRVFSGTNTQTSGWSAAMAYDPLNSGTYSSTSQVLEAQQHVGPIAAPSAGAGALDASPVGTSPLGYHVKRFKCPKGPQVHDPDVVSLYGTGQWTSTGVASTMYGALKFYFEAAGAGSTQFNGFIIMHCRFRVRT